MDTSKPLTEKEVQTAFDGRPRGFKGLGFRDLVVLGLVTGV